MAGATSKAQLSKFVQIGRSFAWNPAMVDSYQPLGNLGPSD